MDNIIECPKHNGRFDYRTGAARGAPVCVDLKTYRVKLEGGAVFIDLVDRRKIRCHRSVKALDKS